MQLSKSVQEVSHLIKEKYMPPGVTVGRYLELLNDSFLQNPKAVVLVRKSKDVPYAIAWCEVTEVGDLFTHYIYAERNGKQLMKDLEDTARKHGCKRITGFTLREEGWVKAMDRKYGYKVIGYWIAKGVE